jgi:hypothetical protein
MIMIWEADYIATQHELPTYRRTAEIDVVKQDPMTELRKIVKLRSILSHRQISPISTHHATRAKINQNEMENK